MQIGLHLPHLGRSATRETVRDFAVLAETLGFDSLWVSDHVIIPKRIDSRYPYNESGEFPFRAGGSFLDPIGTLTFAAACTERVRLGTAVLVLPHRNPVVQAKELATLDVLSGGRLILGIGTGWLREEFAALGVPFERRGARTSEYIELIDRLWTADDTRFEGRFYRLDDVGFFPKPLQQPRPPIWGGGHSEPAYRRAGRRCDGWLGANIDAAGLAGQWQRVQDHAAAAGRDPAALTLAVRIPLRLAEGTEPDWVRTLAGYGAVGAARVIFDVGVPSIDAVRVTLERFVERVRPGLAV
jgi:probable F420-dependent oxidoreductase